MARPRFYYNRTVNNVNVVNIHNTYNRTVVNNVTVNRVSYNGGTGGINARPNAEQEAAARDRHVAATETQTQHAEAARADRNQLASVNHGQPRVAATPRPGAFREAGVAAARNAPENVPATRPNNANAERTANNVPRPPARESNNATRPQTRENTAEPNNNGDS